MGLLLLLDIQVLLFGPQHFAHVGQKVFESNIALAAQKYVLEWAVRSLEVVVCAQVSVFWQKKDWDCLQRANFRLSIGSFDSS